MDGSCQGFTFAGGGRQFYYTEGSDRLMFFVQGDWLKITNRVYDYYYEIKGDTLFLWADQKNMEARRYKSARAYVREGK